MRWGLRSKNAWSRCVILGSSVDQYASLSHIIVSRTVFVKRNYGPQKRFILRQIVETARGGKSCAADLPRLSHKLTKWCQPTLADTCYSEAVRQSRLTARCTLLVSNDLWRQVTTPTSTGSGPAATFTTCGTASPGLPGFGSHLKKMGQTRTSASH